MPYPSDPATRLETLDLLGRIWTKLPAAVERARAWGVDWCDVSTPFVEHDAGRVVAHVGVLEIPVWLAGEPRTVAGIHAVCSDPLQRGRGHMRAAMQRALAWVDARYETALLWANDPGIYGRFGFVAREESMFVGPVHGGPARGIQPLSLEHPADVAFVRERLADRHAVSGSIATREPGWLGLLDLALWTPGPSLAYVPELDCIVVYAVRERFLDLYDVIARDIPSLADIAARLGERIDTAIVYFSPDLLAAPSLLAEPTILIDSLMTRGAWALGDRAFAFSPLTRC